MKDIPRLYDFIYESFPDVFNKNGGSFGRIGCVDKRERGGKKKLFATKFYGNECEYRYPDGFIMPIVVSLHAMIDATGPEVKWRVHNPLNFLEKYLGRIVEIYCGAIRSQDYNPQTVAKTKHSYDVLEQSFKMAFYQEQQSNNTLI
jgi:hypothetical protein